MNRGINTYAVASCVIAWGSGTFVWALGTAGSSYVGLSSLIFGYAAYLIVVGVIDESARLHAFAALCVLGIYTGVFLHIFPSNAAWESHFFGMF